MTTGVMVNSTSAALYGNRASNGVILITTKRGKSDKLSFNVSVNQGIYMRGIPEYDKLGANDWMEMYFEGYSNYLLSSNPARYPDKATANAEAIETIMANLGYNIYNQPDDALFGMDGKLVPGAQIRSGYDDLDWYKAVERIGHRQEYNVSGSGASEKSNYYFSMGYLDEKGQIQYSDFNRWTGRANVSVTPKKWMKAGLSVIGDGKGNNGRASREEYNYRNYTFQQLLNWNHEFGDLCLFRASEMLLTEIEANYFLKNESAAQAGLVKLNKTSGRDPEYTCTKTGEELLKEIKFYRDIELWGEGFNWFDLKRWGDSLVRHTHAEGGNFIASMAVTYGPHEKNEWTWVIPKRETDYNKAIGGSSDN